MDETLTCIGLCIVLMAAYIFASLPDEFFSALASLININ